MTARILMALSAMALLCLGTAHLLLTCWGERLHPREPDLRRDMERVSPVLTRRTTMWDAWVGFNVSHSMGAILFALVYGYLSICHHAFLFGSWFLLAVGLVMLLGYALVGKKYWFRSPMIGISFALVCYCAALVSLFLPTG